MKRWGWGVSCALSLTAFTLGYGIWVKNLQWSEQASFDILGILYLLSNIPTFVAWALLLVFMCLTIWAWLLVVSASRQADREWLSHRDADTSTDPGT